MAKTAHVYYLERIDPGGYAEMYSCVVIANDEQYAREIASRNSGDDMSEHTHGTAQLTKSALVAHIVKHHPEHIYPGRNGLAKWRMDELTGTHNELHGITRFPEQGPCSSCGTKDDIHYSDCTAFPARHRGL